MMIFEFALWIVWVVLNNCGNSKKVNIVNKVKAEKYENRIIIKIRKKSLFTFKISNFRCNFNILWIVYT